MDAMSIFVFILHIAYECKGKFMCGMMGYGYFRHAQCIDMSMVCNGMRDCQSGLDEKNCRTFFK